MKDRNYLIQSSYKLNNSIVKKMVARTIKTSNGKLYPGCSKLMIATLIHFSHICSPKGIIEEYQVKDLELVLHASNRACYKVLKMLEEREFIKVTTLNYWTGMKQIHLLDNDFSDFTDNDYKKSRYLNTNFGFFNYRQNEGYEQFLNLSLYSMRLFICLLHNYNFDKGYHCSFDTLCGHLGIKSRRLIHQYLQEFKVILPAQKPIFNTCANRQKRSPYGSLSISRHIAVLHNKNSLLSATQDTYYTTKWKYKLICGGLKAQLEGHTLHTFANRIAKIVGYHLKHSPNLSMLLIENTLWNILLDNYVLDEQTLTDVDQRLRILATV